MGPGMMGGGFGGGLGMGLFGIVFMAAFWIAVIVGIVVLIRWAVVSTRAGHQAGDPRNSTLDILRQRYARGEINREEFEEKRKALGY